MVSCWDYYLIEGLETVEDLRIVELEKDSRQAMGSKCLDSNLLEGLMEHLVLGWTKALRYLQEQLEKVGLQLVLERQA